MNDPIALLIVVSIIALALALGVVADLRTVLTGLRRGADDGYRNFVSPEGVRLLNVQPEDQVCLLAAGWVPEGLVLPVTGAPRGGYSDTKALAARGMTSTDWRKDRPLHRNFGLSKAGEISRVTVTNSGSGWRDDVAYHSPLESQHWTGDDLLVPGTARKV